MIWSSMGSSLKPNSLPLRNLADWSAGSLPYCRDISPTDLIDPDVERPEPLFVDTVIAKFQKIERLKKNLCLHLMGCGLMLDLLEQITDLEAQIHGIRSKEC